LENIAVKSNRPAPEYSAPSIEYPGGAWCRFWFTPIQPSGLHWLRLLSGLLFLFWLLPFADHQAELFGFSGWCDRQVYLETAQVPGSPPVPMWSLVYFCGENASLVRALWWVAIGVFLLFTFGVATRITSVLTWVLVVSFAANPATHFYADVLLIVLAFYLMIGYLLLGQWSERPTLLGRLIGTRETFLSPWGESRNAGPSYAANLAVRLLQVHFAIIVLISGLRNLQFGTWWGGVAFWYPLHNPFTMTAERLRSEAEHAEVILFFLSLAQYLVLAWQLTFPFFAWRPRWRWLLLAGGVLAWIGSIFVMGEPLYGPIYLIGCLSFLTAAEWQVITSRVASIVQGLTGGVQAQPARKVGARG
jgi:hypothetical protein